MISDDMGKLYPSAKTLVKECVASRIHAKDATLYDFSDEARACAENFMGWADLASHPQCSLAQIQEFADEVFAEGISTVVLIGQGGSTQAPMTITKYNKQDTNRIMFRTLDSDSPVRVRELLALCDPAKTLVIISSKSGSTIEPRLLLCAVRAAFAAEIGEEEVHKHLVAITDPGSDLEKQAHEEGWRKVFLGEPTIGGRFSALSVFGLLPAALVGIDLESFFAHAVEAERRCSEDAIDNPAINLAAFLYDNYLEGRNKFSLFTPKRGRVLGLWIEQLVAESVGKEGKGILPNIEIDSLLLTHDPGDRCIIKYSTKTDLWDERRSFAMSLSCVDPAIPSRSYDINSVEDLAEHFVVWEYAIAMCGYLMQVCPFDQPDVASAKAVVLDILRDGQPEPDYEEEFTAEVPMGTVGVWQAPMFEGCDDVRSSLYALLSSIQPGDFFALNAFVPFTGEGRREALESIRHGVASAFGVVSCLEVGPRYLHSTGQLQKGGTNCGVYLIVSANEMKDINLPSEAESLGALAKAQASGDLITLASRGRRCVHLNLPDNYGVTLRMLARIIDETITEILSDRALAEEAEAEQDREIADEVAGVLAGVEAEAGELDELCELEGVIGAAGVGVAAGVAANEGDAAGELTEDGAARAECGAEA